MKQIFLSLVLLSSMSLLSKNATANAHASAAANTATDVKIKAANVSAGAAAAPESEAKGKASEADLKITGAEAARQLGWGIHNIVMRRACEAALSGPSWQQIERELKSGFQNGNVAMPCELTNIMIDYAQGDLRPMADILQDVMNRQEDQEMAALVARLSPLLSTGVRAAEDRLKEVLRQQGTIFAHGPEVLHCWTDCGFKFDPKHYDHPLQHQRLVCPACNHLIGDRYWSGTFGDAEFFPWREPLRYHHAECKVLIFIQKFLRKVRRKLKRPLDHGKEIVPNVRTEPDKFGGYIMLSLDLHARSVIDTYKGMSRPVGEDGKRAFGFVRLLETVLSIAVDTPWILLYAENPQAWVEAENKRAAELGSPVRYKLPEKPATK